MAGVFSMLFLLFTFVFFMMAGDASMAKSHDTAYIIVLLFSGLSCVLGTIVCASIQSREGVAHIKKK